MPGAYPDVWGLEIHVREMRGTDARAICFSAESLPATLPLGAGWIRDSELSFWVLSYSAQRRHSNDTEPVAEIKHTGVGMLISSRYRPRALLVLSCDPSATTPGTPP